MVLRISLIVCWSSPLQCLAANYKQLYRVISFSSATLDNKEVDRVRLDKWLWAARFFKTRSLATKACDLGRVDLNGQRAKPARDVRLADKLKVSTPGGDFQIEVLQLSEMRGPAPVAQTLYSETEESKELRQKVSQERRAMPNLGALHESRPSKRDRRKVIQFLDQA